MRIAQGLAVAAVFVLAPEMARAENCESLLQNGIFREELLSQSTSYDDDVRQLLCAKDARKHSSSTELGFGITLPLDYPIPINGAFKDDQVDDWEKSHCAGQSRAVSFKQQLTILKSHVFPEVLDAFNQCLKLKLQRPQNLRCDAQYVGGDLFFTYYYEPMAGGGVEVELSPGKGTSCDKAKFKITSSAPVSMRCSARNPTTTLLLNGGGQSCLAVAVRATPPRPPPPEQCPEGCDECRLDVRGKLHCAKCTFDKSDFASTIPQGGGTEAYCFRMRPGAQLLAKGSGKFSVNADDYWFENMLSVSGGGCVNGMTNPKCWVEDAHNAAAHPGHDLQRTGIVPDNGTAVARLHNFRCLAFGRPSACDLSAYQVVLEDVELMQTGTKPPVPRETTSPPEDNVQLEPTPPPSKGPHVTPTARGCACGLADEGLGGGWMEFGALGIGLSLRRRARGRPGPAAPRPSHVLLRRRS